MTDGARNALMGYLYQFSVVASLRAYGTGQYAAGPGWPALLGWVARGCVLSETFNEDAFVMPPGSDKECVAIQVKHSAESAEAIDLRALVEVLHGFEQSRTLAAADGWDVARYCVITNRDRDTGIGAMWTERSGGKLRGAVSARRKRNGWPDWLLKLFKSYRDDAAALDAWAAVIERLEPPVDASPDRGSEILREFARRHGVLNSEVDRSVTTLQGKLFQGTAGGGTVEITEAWLKEGLVGAADARDMTFGSSGGVAAAGAEQVRGRLTRASWCADAPLTRRRIASEMQSKVAQHAVTFVCGPGGTGKSVLAMQHLLAPGGDGPLALSLTAAEATEPFLVNSLRRLRSQNSSHALPNDSFEEAVSRLRAANGQRDLLIVDIDALDEVGSNRGELRRLMARFLDETNRDPGVKLVVSCRPLTVNRNGHHALIREWFGVAYPAAVGDRLGFVDVSDFDAEELREATLGLGEEREDRLRLALGEDDSVHPESLAGFLGEFFNSRVVHRPTLASLRHPVVWGVYASLPPPVRDLVLDGTPDGADRLASGVIERFLTKCAVRRGHVYHEDHLREALREVAAVSTRSPLPYSRVDVWDAACRPALGSDGSAILYGEALTYGLITEDGVSTWRWRHEFIIDWLTRGGA